MTFILVPKQGEEVQVNGWNWRPTLELLLAEGLITNEHYELLGVQGCGGRADAPLASRFAEVIEHKLAQMDPGERMLADLTVTAKPKVLQTFPATKPGEVDLNELYSASYEWLLTFKEFCRRSKGFEVV